MSKGYQDYFLAFSKSSAMVGERSFSRFSKEKMMLSPMLAQCSKDDLKRVFKDLMSSPMHGIAFSPYLDKQSPGINISAEQIKSRMDIIRPYTQWIRTFSCIDGLEMAPRIASDVGLKTMVGVNISENLQDNEMELENGIQIANEGHAGILAIGNEVLLRGDVSEDELLAYIQRAKEVLPNQRIGYVDAYFIFEKYPRVAEICDVILVNCYPFWESTLVGYSISHVDEMIRFTKNIANGKPVIISETGWPSQGTANGYSEPGLCNAMGYFIGVQQWAQLSEIPVFYFSAFDESWKTGDEGDVGAYWGLWDSKGQLKF